MSMFTLVNEDALYTITERRNARHDMRVSLFATVIKSAKIVKITSNINKLQTVEGQKLKEQNKVGQTTICNMAEISSLQNRWYLILRAMTANSAGNRRKTNIKTYVKNYLP